MDSVRASNMTDQLVGTEVDGWLLQSFLGSGKSAIVFEATKNDQTGAVKIFDNEIIERFGRTRQLNRINRERELVGVEHPHLVKILDGGECPLSGHLYVAMEKLSPRPLSAVLNAIPRENISLLIEQLASAAEFLESKEVAHRDIKPDNISINENLDHLTLLDLGIVRPFNLADASEEDAKIFVGTLRYSSPEFLFCEEERSIEGYRALTFYQIGAVLHDLIMCRPIFEEFTNPFMALGHAVINGTPQIIAEGIDKHLINLARNSLVKDPKIRLRLVNWSDFAAQRNHVDKVQLAMERVKMKGLFLGGENKFQRLPTISNQQLLNEVVERMEAVIRRECIGNSAFPPLKISKQTIDNCDDHFLNTWLASDERVGLRTPVCIRFRSLVIDPTSRSVEVHAAAGLVTDLETEPLTDQQTPIFLGPADSESLDEKIIATLYVAIDAAQESFYLNPTQSASKSLILKEAIE